MIRKITVNAELSRSANSNAKEENLIPENGTIYCGKVYTFVNAATYAEAIEIAKIKFEAHFRNTGYILGCYGALNYCEKDEERKDYQTFIP